VPATPLAVEVFDDLEARRHLLAGHAEGGEVLLHRRQVNGGARPDDDDGAHLLTDHRFFARRRRRSLRDGPTVQPTR
jgi:hypothetical protein